MVIEKINGRDHTRTDGRMDGWTDERTNGMDENYIPLRHTSYAEGIISATKNNISVGDIKSRTKFKFIPINIILVPIKFPTFDPIGTPYES